MGGDPGNSAPPAIFSKQNIWKGGAVLSLRTWCWSTVQFRQVPKHIWQLYGLSYFSGCLKVVRTYRSFFMQFPQYGKGTPGMFSPLWSARKIRACHRLVICHVELFQSGELLVPYDKLIWPPLIFRSSQSGSWKFLHGSFYMSLCHKVGGNPNIRNGILYRKIQLQFALRFHRYFLIDFFTCLTPLPSSKNKIRITTVYRSNCCWTLCWKDVRSRKEKRSETVTGSAWENSSRCLAVFSHIKSRYVYWRSPP